ncbi:MAG: hypothetical protein ACE14L_06080 [Terriglobales bacterium]
MSDAVRRLESVPEPAVEPGPGPAPLPSSNLPAELPSRAETPMPREGKPLNEAAGKVGAMIGSAAKRVRTMPQRAKELKHRLTIVRSQKMEDVADTTAELRQRAQQQAREARMRVQVWADQKPIQMIAGAAGAAFVLGFVLRTWRGNHGR